MKSQPQSYAFGFEQFVFKIDTSHVFHALLFVGKWIKDIVHTVHCSVYKVPSGELLSDDHAMIFFLSLEKEDKMLIFLIMKSICNSFWRGGDQIHIWYLDLEIILALICHPFAISFIAIVSLMKLSLTNCISWPAAATEILMPENAYLEKKMTLELNCVNRKLHYK